VRLRLFLYILLFIPLLANGQEDYKKLIKTGDRYYNDEQYVDAAFFYLKADSIKSLGSDYSFNLAFSLLNIDDRKLEAIPYLEKALKNRKNDEQLIHKELGTLYHQIFQFDKAISHFTQYLNNAGRDDKFIIYCERMLETCNNAKKIFSKKKDYDIKPLPYPLLKENTKSVFTTVDGQVIFFQTKIGDIYKSEIQHGRYQEPIRIIKNEKLINAELVNISIDAQILYFRILNRNNYDLYKSQLIGLTLQKPEELPGEVNTKFNEFDLTISADGTVLLFSSDRPGGYGKSDIYIANRLKNNDWSTPDNIGPEINTPFNEKSPFLHASGNYLYFASEGHENIGGYDIFKSEKTDLSWSIPENVVYINTIYNDMSFSQTANGNLVVYSRPKDFDPEIHNLWSVNLSQNIPLTIVKGTIQAGEPLQPVKAKIKVYEPNGERMKYVYDPNPITGKYLLIFPPGKDYDMIINADEFLPQLIHIKVPNQTYFHELFQEIRLYSITVSDKKVGEKIEVENVFYDIYQTNLSDSLIQKYKPEREKNYDHLLQIVEDIINTTDSLGIENMNDMRETPQVSQNDQQESYDHLLSLIEGAISTTDSVSLALLDEQTVENEESSDTYFYSSNQLPHEYLNQTIYKGDTLYTKPRIETNELDKVKNVAKSYDFNYRNLTQSQKTAILTKTIYFDVNEVFIKTQYLYDIGQITDLLYDNPSLGIEIHGYADERGSAEYNEQLSQRRANEVFKKIQSERIKSNRIIIEGHGEEDTSKNTSSSLSKSRRVDIIIFKPFIKEGEK
jgi:outer membrane protein OmpA-like peptidoglycan-associated protein